MAQSQKTIKIADLIENVNRRNRESTCSAEVRLGWNLLLEDILQNTDNYMGYQYLTQEEVPDNELPGKQQAEDGELEFPDETRRVYFIPNSLTK